MVSVLLYSYYNLYYNDNGCRGKEKKAGALGRLRHLITDEEFLGLQII